jgi:hypothetical protein
VTDGVINLLSMPKAPPARVRSFTGNWNSERGQEKSPPVVAVPTENTRIDYDPELEGLLGDHVQILDLSGRTRGSVSFQLLTANSPKNIPARFSGHIRVEQMQLETVDELPLHEGSRLVRGSVQMVVSAIKTIQSGAEITLSRQVPNRFFTKPSTVERAIRDPMLLVVNRRLKQAIRILEQDSHHRAESGSLPGLAFFTNHYEIRLPVASPEAAKAWLADATLCIFVETPQNFYTVPVTFPVPAAKP